MSSRPFTKYGWKTYSFLLLTWLIKDLFALRPHSVTNTMQQTISIVCLVLVVIAKTGARHRKIRDQNENRKGKFFGIFNIVSFPNDLCNGTNDMQGKYTHISTILIISFLHLGVCLSSRECSDKGGESSGTCASGFGTCCSFIERSDSMMGMATFDTKVAYLQNPNYPQKHDDALVHTIQLVALNEDICQIRLDFLEFEIDGGSVIDKPCDRDMFRVTGSGGMNLGIGDLCGTNTGQHLYIPMQGSRGGPANIRIITSDRQSGIFNDDFKWNVKVTQVGTKIDMKGTSINHYSSLTAQTQKTFH